MVSPSNIKAMFPMHIAELEMNVLAGWSTLLMVMHIRLLVVLFEGTVLVKFFAICTQFAQLESSLAHSIAAGTRLYYCFCLYLWWLAVPVLGLRERLLVKLVVD